MVKKKKLLFHYSDDIIPSNTFSNGATVPFFLLSFWSSFVFHSIFLIEEWWYTILYEFQCTTYWLNMYLFYKLITTSLVTICHHKSYWNIIGYNNNAMQYIPVTYLMTGSLYLNYPSPIFPKSLLPLPLVTTSLFSLLLNLFLFSFYGSFVLIFRSNI